MQQSAIIQSLANQECFSTEYFENQDLESLLCPIGLGIVNNPVFDPCGHVFCKTCIQKWLVKSQKCPVNNSPLTKEQLTPALPIRNLILNLNMNCFNHCQWKGKLEFYDKHQLQDCPETLVSCSNDNCDQKIKRVNLDIHQKLECLYKLGFCIHCGLKFQVAALPIHIEQCDQRLVECKSCQKQVRHGMMDGHLQDTCESRIVQCSINGCQYQTAAIKMNDHMEQNKDHINLLQQQVIHLKGEIDEQKQKVNDLQQRMDQQKQIPYLDGYSLSFKKKEQSREWNSINSMQKIGSYFKVKFQITGLQARSNSWRSVIGISSNRLSQYLWYKSENTYVWIMGGLKCQGNKSPEPYGVEVEGSFNATMTLDRNCQLTFQHNFTDFGVAFQIDKEIVDGGFYLMLSCINAGKFKIIEYQLL